MHPKYLTRFPRTEREARPQPPANETLCFPRTQREAGWSDDAEWEGKRDGSGIVGTLFAALAGVVVLWVFLVLVLGLSVDGY